MIGIGLDGVAGLSEAMQNRVMAASLLVGSDRHLGYFPEYPGERWVLGDLGQAIDRLKTRINDDQIVIERGILWTLSKKNPIQKNRIFLILIL